MRGKRLAFIILLALSPFCFLFAGVNSYIIPLDSSFYDSIDALYRIAGEVSPVSSRPWSYSEAELVFSRIEENELPEAAMELYDSVEKELSEAQPRWMVDGESFGFSARLSIQPEIYTHTNGDEFRSEESWVYDYDDRTPFLHLGLDMSAWDFFYTYCDLMYTMGRYSRNGIEYYTIPQEGVGAIIPSGNQGEHWIVSASRQYFDPFSTNIPYTSSEFSFEWPRRAFISFGGEHWNFFLGRDRIKWGSSEIGNFIFDDHVGWHDMARLTIYSNRFRYEWTNLFLSTKYNTTETEAEDGSIKLYMAHRLDFRITDWVSFTISENVMYHGPSLNPTYLNPGFIYHNLNDRSIFNAIAHAELSLLPVRGLELYAQAVLDQATAPNEDDSQGAAWGLLGGVRYTQALPLGYIEPSIEFVYTSPLLYRRDGVDFLMFQREFSYNTGGNPIKLNYIGFPYGGDVIMLQGKVNWVVPSRAKLSLAVSGMLKGQMDFFQSHNKDGNNSEKPNISGAAPSGDEIQRYLTVTLEGEYEFDRLWDLVDISLWSSISLVATDTYIKSSSSATGGRSDVQFVFGASLRI